MRDIERQFGSVFKDEDSPEDYNSLWHNLFAKLYGSHKTYRKLIHRIERANYQNSLAKEQGRRQLL